MADLRAAYLFLHHVLFVKELHFDVSTHRQRLGKLKVHVFVFTPRVCWVRCVDFHLQLVHHKLWICVGDICTQLLSSPPRSTFVYSAFRKYSDPIVLPPHCVMLQFYTKMLLNISHVNLHSINHNDKSKTRCTKLLKIIKTEISHQHKYSDL